MCKRKCARVDRHKEDHRELVYKKKKAVCLFETRSDRKSSHVSTPSPSFAGGWEGSDVCVDVCMRKEKLERVALIIKRCSLGNHRMDRLAKWKTIENDDDGDDNDDVDAADGCVCVFVLAGGNVTMFFLKFLT